jgi:hypothetical protein
VLYDTFAKWELQISLDEIEEDLHKRSAELLNELYLTCHLGEVPLYIFDDPIRKRIIYLRDRFIDLNYAKQRRYEKG